MTETIGFVAATLTSLAFLPQVIKTWRSGAAGDLSLFTLVMQSSGVALWVYYAVQIRSVPVLASNVLTLGLMLTLLALKLRHS